MKKFFLLALGLIMTIGAKAEIINLGSLHTLSMTKMIYDGDVLTGTMYVAAHLKIAPNATITLDDAHINPNWLNMHLDAHEGFHGLEATGNATIIVKGTNEVYANGSDYAGIYVEKYCTLTIVGNSPDNSDTLIVFSGGKAAGIGAGRKYYSNILETNHACGGIVINGATILAVGGRDGAGIGGSKETSCGNITINGGNVYAAGGYHASGIGSGTHVQSLGDNYWSTCASITINGGCVIARGGEGAAGIGGGYNSRCGEINISNQVTCLSVIAGDNAPYSIGRGGGNSSNSIVRVMGLTYSAGMETSPFIYPTPVTPTTCPTPANLAVSDITATSVQVQWTRDNTCPFYQLRYWKQYDNDGVYETVENITKPPYTLTGLRPGTTYQVWIVGECDDNVQSTPSGKVAFSTQTSSDPDDFCPKPADVYMANVNTNSAMVMWTPGAKEQTEWILRYYKEGEASSPAYKYPTEPYCTLTNLLSDTKYWVSVRGKCGDGLGNSNFTDYIPFTTGSSGCKTPTNLRYAYLTASTALIEWDEGAYDQDQWYIRWRVANTGTWVGKLAYTPSFLLTSLTPKTQYEVQVYTVCGKGNNSAYTPSLNFTTGPAGQDIDQITNDQLQMTNKVLRDGKLFIEINGHVYDAQGKEVK